MKEFKYLHEIQPQLHKDMYQQLYFNQIN